MNHRISITCILLSVGLYLTMQQAVPVNAQEAAGTVPAKELRQTFEQGYHLYQAGQYDKALELFDKNLKIDPASKGSLLFSGLSFLELAQFERAVEYLDRFLKLEPLNESGLIGAVKANQALKRNEEVERLRKIILQQRNSGANPKLKGLLSYERQMMPLLDGGRFSVLENMENKGSYVWAYLLLGPDKKTIKRRLELAPVPPGTAGGGFVLGELLGDATHTTGYKVHKLYATLPGFEAVRQDAMIVLGLAPQAGKEKPTP